MTSLAKTQSLIPEERAPSKVTDKKMAADQQNSTGRTVANRNDENS
jgi:hypothetical protein